VFLPLLTNNSNQQGWPEIVAKEVTENLHRFVANGAYNNKAPLVHSA
jgi:dynein heavy chain